MIWKCSWKWGIHDYVIKYGIFYLYFVSQSFGKGAGHNDILLCFTLFHKARIYRTPQLSKCINIKKNFATNSLFFEPLIFWHQFLFRFNIKLSYHSWMIFSLILIHWCTNDIFFIFAVWFLLMAVQNVYLLLYYYIPKKYIFNYQMINKHWLQIPSNK